MRVLSRSLRVRSGDGVMAAYLCRPSSRGKCPVLLLFHEAFGLNSHIRSIARGLAGEGFVALALDLYYREKVRTAPYEDLPRALQLRDTLRDDKLAEDVGDVLRAAMRLEYVAPGSVGAVGFCMGGRYAFLCAGRIAEIGPVVSYYGGGIVPSDKYPPSPTRPVAPIQFLPSVRGPMLFFFGGADALIPRRSVNDLRKALQTSRRKDWQVRVYPGAAHGFNCDDRPAYHPPSARDAWARMLRFFRKAFQSSASGRPI